MPTYDSSSFDPPAPLAIISLRNPENDQTVTDVPMLIDSGSDVTLIPRRFLTELKLNLNQDNTYELEGFDGGKTDGGKTIAQSVHLALKFLRRTFSGRFVVIDSQNGILGRNVLNHFALLFDGPHLSWSEKNESTE